MIIINTERELIYIINKRYNDLKESGNKIDLTNMNIQCKINFKNLINKLNSDIMEEIDNEFHIKVPLDFSYTIFSEKVDFSDATFNKEVYFIFATFNKEVDFSDATFNKEVNFSNATFNKEVEFTGTTFNEVNFSNATFIEKVNFSDATFNKEVYFMFATFNNEVDFSDANFNKEVDFSDANFNKEVDFSFATFNEVDFYHATFIEEVDFSFAKFNKEVDFLRTQFDGIGAFLKCYFKNDLIFENIILGKESHIYFREVNQKNLYNQKVHSIKFSLKNTIVNGRLDFDNNNFETLDLKGSAITGILSRVNSDPECENKETECKDKERKCKDKKRKCKDKERECENWETACILKNEAIKKNNIIETLKYQAEEKDLYSTTLSENDFGEKFSLSLSKKFHDHGQNWVQAFFNTIALWILCYLSYRRVICCSFFIHGILHDVSCYENLFAGLIGYLSISDYEPLLDYLRRTDINVLWQIIGIFPYILGKIVIPYGIFEVVRAFRKFK